MLNSGRRKRRGIVDVSWHARASTLRGRELVPCIGVAGIEDLVMGLIECWRLASYLTKACSLDQHACGRMAVACFEVERRGGRVRGTTIQQLVLTRVFCSRRVLEYRRDVVTFAGR